MKCTHVAGANTQFLSCYVGFVGMFEMSCELVGCVVFGCSRDSLLGWGLRVEGAESSAMQLRQAPRRGNFPFAQEVRYRTLLLGTSAIHNLSYRHISSSTR